MCRTGGYVSIGHMSLATRLDVNKTTELLIIIEHNVAYGVARFLMNLDTKVVEHIQVSNSI